MDGGECTFSIGWFQAAPPVGIEPASNPRQGSCIPDAHGGNVTIRDETLTTFLTGAVCGNRTRLSFLGRKSVRLEQHRKLGAA